MSKLKIAGATLNQTPLDWENNLKNILEAIQTARDEKVDILCLPELCITAYGCEDLFLSNWLPQKAMDYLLEIKESCIDIVVVLGLPIRLQKDLYNCACIIENTEILGFYAKQYLALDGVHYEPRWFKAWRKGKLEALEIQGKYYPFGDLVYEAKGVRIGIEICEDAWHGDKRPAIAHCKKGAELILSLNASHFAFGKLATRKKLVLDIAQRFNCAYVYTNLLGNESGKMIYGGDILIAQGHKILQLNERMSFKNVNMVTADIDFSNPGNSHSDKPIVEDNEDKNVDFVKTVSLALFDYLRKSRSKGFALSLSGGADSATCAILVAEMVRRGVEDLGFEEFAKKINVFSPEEIIELQKSRKNKIAYTIHKILVCAYQAAGSSSRKTLASARSLAKSINAQFHNWDIGEEVATYTKKIETALHTKLTWEHDDITLQNIQARTRSPIIWMLTNYHNFLLLATSNRSEGSVGYCTMDGDTCGSISPIAGVDKYFVRSWLEWAELELGYKGLNPVNNLVPTAELRPKENEQSDETDLMPYHILQAIEELAIRDHQSPKQILSELTKKGLEESELLKKYIKKFFLLWSRNQWKRERLAPAFHLDDYNVDPRSWCRFPILSGGFREELVDF